MSWAGLLSLSAVATALAGLAGLSANPPWAAGVCIGGFFAVIILLRLMLEISTGELGIRVTFHAPVSLELKASDSENR